MKKKYYLTLDTETATLPFANSIASTSLEKQKIAIAKPLVYDIGWVITDRENNIIKTENFLVQETFFVPNVFNTAYYKNKRPKYMEMFQKGEIKALPWNEIVEILLTDLRTCDICLAYNATFDFKKAIPFTERYIKALYSPYYDKWEERQKQSCDKIVQGFNSSKNDKFLEPLFILRNEEFPIADLWVLACEKLVNNQRYKDFCLENELLTQSGIYFKTSAESVFQYLTRNSQFIEDHTALSDALIESEILHKLLKKGKVEAVLGAFPFRTLGNTYDYVQEERKIKYIDVVVKVMENYVEASNPSRYRERIENIIDYLVTIGRI